MSPAFCQLLARLQVAGTERPAAGDCGFGHYCYDDLPHVVWACFWPKWRNIWITAHHAPAVYWDWTFLHEINQVWQSDLFGHVYRQRYSPKYVEINYRWIPLFIWLDNVTLKIIITVYILYTDREKKRTFGAFEMSQVVDLFFTALIQIQLHACSYPWTCIVVSAVLCYRWLNIL